MSFCTSSLCLTKLFREDVFATLGFPILIFIFKGSQILCFKRIVKVENIFCLILLYDVQVGSLSSLCQDVYDHEHCFPCPFIALDNSQKLKMFIKLKSVSLQLLLFIVLFWEEPINVFLIITISFTFIKEMLAHCKNVRKYKEE